MGSEKTRFIDAMSTGFKALFRYRSLGLIFALSTLGQGIFQALLVWSFREVLVLFVDSQRTSFLSLILGASLVLAISLLQSLTGFGSDVYATRIAYRAETDSMLAVLQKLLQLPVQFYEQNSEGDLIVSSYYDMRGIRYITLEVGRTLLYISRLIGLAIIALCISPKLTIIGLVAIPLVAFPAQLFGDRITRAADKQRDGLATLHDSFVELSTGIRVIKVNQGEQRLFQKAQHIGQNMYQLVVQQAYSRGWARFLLEAVSGIGLILVLTIGGRDVALGRLDWQSLLSLLIAVLGVYSPIVSLLNTYSTIRQMIPNLERTERILAVPVTVSDAPNAQPLDRTPRTIELRDVSFGYNGVDVLSGLSATFQQSETIGIVGPSGAGKSTLISLLLRFYDPTNGQIVLDGVDLRELRRADVMDQCAIVLQEPFLFLDTVANNIRMARPSASLEDVIAAAKAANIHDEILQMDDGYETMLGRSEEGRGLSVGQKQRICIAAALLKNAPILFLDEATSNLDSVSERKVQDAIDRLMNGRTTFIIAHRMSTLRSADRILVLNGGRMVGLGTHRDLLVTCETYRRLWNGQTLDTAHERTLQQTDALVNEATLVTHFEGGERYAENGTS